MADEKAFEAAGAMPGIVIEHPEYGTYHVRPAGKPLDDFEMLYYDHLMRLVCRKWQNLFQGPPYPEMQRAELVNDRDLEPGCPFAPVQGLILRLPVKPWNQFFMKPGKLEKSLAKNGVLYREIAKNTAVVSPFFEWELAEFWEEDRYGLD